MSPSRMMMVVLTTMMTSTMSLAANLDETAAFKEEVSLEGKSFDGRTRARGIVGLFAVKGTLSFQDGEMTWTAQGDSNSAPYQIRETEGGILFNSKVAAEQDTIVHWSGFYDGATLSDVEAVWHRKNEEDFVHDLFLGEKLTLRFKPDKAK